MNAMAPNHALHDREGLEGFRLGFVGSLART